MPDLQQYPEKLSQIKSELDINAYVFLTRLFSFPGSLQMLLAHFLSL